MLLYYNTHTYVIVLHTSRTRWYVLRTSGVNLGVSRAIYIQTRTCIAKQRGLLEDRGSSRVRVFLM